MWTIQMYISGETPALPLIGNNGVDHRKYSPHAPPMLTDGGVPPPQGCQACQRHARQRLKGKSNHCNCRRGTAS